MTEKLSLPSPANDRFGITERRIAEKDLKIASGGREMVAPLNGFIWKVTSFDPCLKSVKTGIMVWRVTLRRPKRRGGFVYAKGYIVRGVD